MKIYLVGGAVRDILMGITPKDRDFVVVGSSESEMLSLGYEKVGSHFPVFLDPKTKEEYALARKEIKTSSGYYGFKTITENVSLEDDLYRRDLTINAMAMDDTGNIIDPYNGQIDIKNKILKHVSPHFSEDPVRVFRVARFSARYSDFNISIETKQLMKELVKKESENLVSERIYSEFDKAFNEYESERFLQELYDVEFFDVYFGIKNEIKLHHNWKLLSNSHKWAFLLKNYPQFKKLNLTNYEKKLSGFYQIICNNSLEYSFENSWKIIQQLRLLNHADKVAEDIHSLLTEDQIKFLNFLIAIVNEFNSIDKSLFTKSTFFEQLEEEKKKAWNKISSIYSL